MREYSKWITSKPGVAGSSPASPTKLNQISIRKISTPLEERIVKNYQSQLEGC
jgi:hypothetical protein